MRQFLQTGKRTLISPMPTAAMQPTRSFYVDVQVHAEMWLNV